MLFLSTKWCYFVSTKRCYFVSTKRCYFVSTSTKRCYFVSTKRCYCVSTYKVKSALGWKSQSRVIMLPRFICLQILRAYFEGVNLHPPPFPLSICIDDRFYILNSYLDKPWFFWGFHFPVFLTTFLLETASYVIQS